MFPIHYSRKELGIFTSFVFIRRFLKHRPSFGETGNRDIRNCLIPDSPFAAPEKVGKNWTSRVKPTVAKEIASLVFCPCRWTGPRTLPMVHEMAVGKKWICYRTKALIQSHITLLSPPQIWCAWRKRRWCEELSYFSARLTKINHMVLISSVRTTETPCDSLWCWNDNM